MLQTQPQATVNLGTARAGLVLAAVIAAAAVVGQLIATNPVTLPATGAVGGAAAAPAVVVPELASRSAEFATVGAATFSTWEIDAGQRRAGSSDHAAPVTKDAGSMRESNLYESRAQLSDPSVSSTPAGTGGGSHKGQFIPQ